MGWLISSTTTSSTKILFKKTCQTSDLSKNVASGWGNLVRKEPIATKTFDRTTDLSNLLFKYLTELDTDRRPPRFDIRKIPLMEI